MKENLPQAIEAILFATAEPQTYASLANRLEVDIDAITTAVQELTGNLEGHGIAVTSLNQVLTLATKGEYGALIEAIRKDELSTDLSKASSETLAIIAYMPGVSKSQIEFIRGVNASYSVRALLMRGLIEQHSGGRSQNYQPTVLLLEHFGISSIEQLPDYAETKAKIESLLTPSAS